jgi:hypothetical protein
MAAGVNGRVSALERLIAPPAPHLCRSCGLRHVQPLSLDLIRSVIRVAGGSAGDVAGGPTPLCLCPCCTGDPGDRWLALLSRGLSEESP